MIPSAFASEQNGNISYVVEAKTGEQLKYVISNPDGTTNNLPFLPREGTITLLNTMGTFVSQYTAPTVTVEREFEYLVTISNLDGHAISATFKTKVKPPGKTDGVRDTELRVLFNPVINGLKGQRAAGTSNVTWTADVTDDDLPASLTYEWLFTPAEGTSYNPMPVFVGNTSSSTLQNYTMAVQGTVEVAVTDSNGGKTKLSYLLKPNFFPDNPVTTGPNDGINTIRTGGDHTCVLFNNGDVRCWGRNSNGQLGYADKFHTGGGSGPYPDSTTSSFPYPYNRSSVNMVGVGSKLAIGSNHTCALLDIGAVRCWGSNSHGQLGYKLPTTENVGDAEQVYAYGFVNLGGNAVKLVAGANHNCVMMDTGKVRCWGDNKYGQLGYSTNEVSKLKVGDDELPYTMGDVEVGGTVRDIAAGGDHTCALLSTNAVRCWGRNDYGQLGLGTTSNVGDDEHPSARPTIDLGGPVVQVSVGALHTCALLATGNMRCWGNNDNGRLGYGKKYAVLDGLGNVRWYVHVGDEQNEMSGLPDVSVGDVVLQVAADSAHTCALLSSGGIKCWGYNGFGQLGLSNTTEQNAPTSTVDLDGNSAYQLATGKDFTCALLANGKARCWGLNSFGQLGLGHRNNALKPTDVQLFPPAP